MIPSILTPEREDSTAEEPVHSAFTAAEGQASTDAPESSQVTVNPASNSLDGPVLDEDEKLAAFMRLAEEVRLPVQLALFTDSLC